MQLITLLDNNDVVTIEITVQGNVAWRYDYVAYDYTYTHTSKDAPPYQHALGFARELDGERHFWDFSIDNLTSNAVAYSTSIVWKQGTTQIGKWSSSGTAEADEFVPINDNARLRIAAPATQPAPAPTTP